MRQRLDPESLRSRHAPLSARAEHPRHARISIGQDSSGGHLLFNSGSAEATRFQVEQINPQTTLSDGEVGSWSISGSIEPLLNVSHVLPDAVLAYDNLGLLEARGQATSSVQITSKERQVAAAACFP